jgi:2-polyprenyl-3-methyl-5-hydroxy-6-metoxy-1,4-benzoquinol methylase
MIKDLYLHLVSSDPESKKLLSLINKYAQPDSRILDVGCGYGRNLEVLRRAGYQRVTGIEINLDIVEANKKRGLACISVDELNFEVDKFDLILMSHVIEHFSPPDLKAFIDGYLECLLPDGYLIVATPLMSSYFYDDFDHVKPYHPMGILQVFGTNKSQIQYYSKNKLILEDLWFRKSHYHLSYFKGNYIKGPQTRMIQIATFLSAFLFFVSGGIIGKKDGWIGVFQKVDAK